LRRTAAAALAATLALGAAGCGNADDHDGDSRQPPAAARAAVVDYLTALQRKDYAAACAAVDAATAKDLRDAAVGEFRVRPGSASDRLKQVHTAHARAATCPGAMALVVEETGARLVGVVARARSAPLTYIGPVYAGNVALGDEDWGVERHGDGWRVIIDNVLPAGE
jgi:hypothetical protein